MKKLFLLFSMIGICLPAQADNVDVFGKRYQSQPKCILKNSGVTNQCEENVDEFYFKSQEELPFTLGSINGKTYSFTESSSLSNLFHNHKMPDGSAPGVDQFGQFTVLLSETQWFTVRENQYYVGKRRDGKIGLGARFIPIDDGNVESPLNKQLDEFLNLQAGSPIGSPYIFNPIVYYHPEYFVAPADALGDSHRFDDGFTHMGAYIGKRRTRNAPYSYHSRRWALQQGGSYPANIYKVSYDGANQTEFDKNAYITTRLLNESGDGVQFSRLDYEKDYFDGNNLKAIFDFYRGWLDHDWVRPGDSKPFYSVMIDDLRYDTYCAEHITMIINVALNLVQTQQGYLDVFGKNSDRALNPDGKGGEHFWAKAQENWQNLKVFEESEPFPVVDAGKITPLWKYQGLDAPQPEVGGVFRGQAVSAQNVTKITYPGFSMAWAPQTLPDMISDFMAYYGRWDKVGPEGSKGLLAAFKEEVFSRIPQISEQQFTRSVGKIAKLIDEYAPTGNYDAYRVEVSKELEKLRNSDNLDVDSDAPEQFFYYSPPPVLNRIANGLHRRNKFFHVEILGTAVDHWEVEEVESQTVAAGSSRAAEPVSPARPSTNDDQPADDQDDEEEGGKRRNNNDDSEDNGNGFFS